MKDFSHTVIGIVRNIPAGKVMSYQEVARAAGRPRAWRAVGNVLNKNYDPGVPCHRVIRSDGKTGGYNRGAGRKALALRREGFKTVE